MSGAQHFQPSRLRAGLGLLVCFAVTFLAARLGSIATTPNLGWYETLEKPWFTPPNWAFPVAWTILFALMAVALFIVWRGFDFRLRAYPPLIAFALQLVLNVGWSFAFFAARSPGLGLVAIVALMAAIVWTIRAFAGRSRGAALLLVPYILWVGYAALLNFSIFSLNT